jgi:WD40 repeat protein
MTAWAGRALLLMALVCGVLCAPTARAAEPTAEPLLRVETGMHTALIRRVAVDTVNNRLITSANDKSVRVWQLPDLRLVSVLRIPIDAGHEGQIYGLTVSPDGKTVAVAGWTGWDWDKKSSIYFIDIATGNIVRRIGGLKDVITYLTWSPDGQHLAIGYDNAGFAVLRLKDGVTVAEDLQYKDKLIDIDFSSQGELVALAFDGLARLYDAKTFKLKARRVIPGGRVPVTVRYSPDGNFLAFGFLDTSAVAVAAGIDLTFLYHANTAPLKGQISFNSVVWSSDGNYVYAGGEQQAGSGMNSLYRWGNRGRGVPERIPLAENRIWDIQQMPNGQIAFALEDPGLGVVNPDGSVPVFRGPDNVNFSRARNQLLVSDDAQVVTYPVTFDGKTRHGFNTLGAGDQSTAIDPKIAVAAPRLEAPDIKLENWLDSDKPIINGQRPVLDALEQVRAYAITPDGNAVLLGTEWAVRLLNPDATQRWAVKLPATAWAVNISGNGRFAVAALSDGTIRWYRMRDGGEVLSYFPHANGRDWISWTPDGYYTSSLFGDNYIGWHLNRGKDLTPDFYRAVQFDRILYRPDVVAQHFRTAMGVTTRDLGTSAMSADFKIAKLREIAPPRLRLQVQSVDNGSSPRAVLKLDGEKNALDIRDYTVFVNNIPVTPNRERQLRGREAREFSRTIEIDLPARANDIRVESFNGVSMGVAETYVSLDREVAPPREAGNLYVLAVGINVFRELPESMHLAFAARDAEQLASSLAEKGKGYYKQVHTRVLSDGSRTRPTRRAINDALSFVQQAQANDTVVIFLASHGLSDPAGNYYFVPSDVTLKDVNGVQKGEKAESLIPWTAFSDALRSAAGKRILVVDTCHAARIEGKFESHSLMKRSASSLFPMIMASKGEEQSQEYEPAKHGLFTYAVIQSLTAATDKNKDGLLSVQEIFDAALPLVDKLREKSIGPQSPQIVAPASLGNMAVLSATRAP